MVNNKSNRRKYPRYQVKENVFFYDNENISEILNISAGGLAIRLSATAQITDINSVVKALMLDYSTKCCVEDVECEVINSRTEYLNHLIAPTPHYTCNIKFLQLSERQSVKVEKFIEKCRVL